MILPTMTLSELTRELRKDYREVSARWKAFMPKFERMRKRQTMFPWFWEATVKTKRNNSWSRVYYAFTKKDAACIWPQVYITFRHENATWAAFFVNGEDWNFLFLFTSHFFERYVERLLKSSRQEMGCMVNDVVKYFFLRNHHIMSRKPELEGSIKGLCEDGIFLGDLLSGDTGLVKTYLSRDELKVNQYTEYFEAMMSGIVSDMFMSRNRHTMTDEEEAELSDEHYSTFVWREFLFSRNNPIWNELFVDCLTFRKEHPEEYRKISDMFEIIADNRRDARC